MIIPNEFQVKDPLYHKNGVSLRVKAQGKKIGYIKMTDILIEKQFELINCKKQLIAICRQHSTDHGSTFQIFDEFNNRVGSIQKLLYFDGSKCEKYLIRNVNNQVIAETPINGKMENDVEFFDNNKVKITVIKEQTGLMNKKWKFNLFGKFDRRLLIFLPTFIGKQLRVQGNNK